MSDTPDHSTRSSVLRPFVEPDLEPLPADDPWTTVDQPVAPASPVEEPSQLASAAIADAALTGAELTDAELSRAGAPRDPATVVTEQIVATEAVAVTPSTSAGEDGSAAGGSRAMPADRPRVGLGFPGFEDAGPDDLVPDLGPETRDITIGRAPFLLGLGILLAIIAALAVLWRTAGDGSPTETAERPAPTVTEGVVIDTSDADALTAALAEETERADGAEQRVTDLEGQVATLEEELASQPIPALPASALDRTIIATDAQFVSATEASVAVVGPFGGYANIDPSNNTVTASGQIGSEATRVLRTPSTVWATNFAGDELVRLDPVTNQVVGSYPFPGPDGLAKDGDNLLVASFSEGFVARVDPNDGTILDQVNVGGNATAVAIRDDRIYAAVFETGEVVKIDPSTFEVLDRAIVGAGPVGLLPGSGDRVWVSNRNEGTVARVDFETGDIVSVPVGEGPVELASAFDSLWVAVADAGELVQIDFAELDVVTRTPLGGAPTGLSVGAGSLWVGVSGDRSVVRVTL